LPTIGQTIDEAMEAVEKENKELKNVLPQVFGKANLDKTSLGEFKKEPSVFQATNFELMLRIAKFILESFQVVWLLSCPYTVMSFTLPLCSVTKS
jgi:type I restriction-modification system DNA methylase subunit